MKKIGYLRVSTREQRPDRQIDALRDICDEMHVERLSAANLKRPVYNEVVAKLSAGDALVILDLDRAYRSTVDAITEMEKLRDRGVHMRIVNLMLDTTTPSGMFVYSVMAACATFERQMLSQRTKEGLAAAKERGKKLGRPAKLNEAQLAKARERLKRSEQSLAMIAAEYRVAPWTLARSLRRSEESSPS